MGKEKIDNIVLGVLGILGLVVFYVWMPVGHDTPFHIGRIANEVSMIQEHGLRNVPYYIFETARGGYGYGSPLFYCDLFIYPFAGLVLLGVSRVTAYKLMMVSIILLAFFSTYFSLYQWKENRNLAVWGAALYILNPYFVADMVERAAVGEAFALAFMPLACCGIYLLLSTARKKRGMICLTIGMSGVICSHVISTLLLCIYFCIIVLFSIKRLNRDTVKYLFLAATLCVCLTMWYWLPMLEQLCNIQFATQLEGGGYVERKCSVAALFIPNGLYEILAYKFRIFSNIAAYTPGGMIWGAIIIAGYMVYNKKYRQNRIIKGCFWSWVALIILASSKNLCAVLQNVIGVIQFPWRWYILLVPISTVAFVELAGNGRKTKYVLLMATLLLSASGVAMTMERSVLQKYTANQETYKNLAVFETNNGALDSLYLPANCSLEYCEEKGSRIDCDKAITYQVDRKGNQFTIAPDTQQKDMEFELPLVMYKGYYAYNVDFGEEYTVSESVHGLVSVAVSDYSGGRIRVYYKGTAAQRISRCISMISWCAFLIGIIYKAWHSLARNKKKTSTKLK